MLNSGRRVRVVPNQALCRVVAMIKPRCRVEDKRMRKYYREIAAMRNACTRAVKQRNELTAKCAESAALWRVISGAVLCPETCAAPPAVPARVAALDAVHPRLLPFACVTPVHA